MADPLKNQQKRSRDRRRLSAALRDNLRRRKAQAKGRASGREPEHARIYTRGAEDACSQIKGA